MGAGTAVARGMGLCATPSKVPAVQHASPTNLCRAAICSTALEASTALPPPLHSNSHIAGAQHRAKAWPTSHRHLVAVDLGAALALLHPLQAHGVVAGWRVQGDRRQLHHLAASQCQVEDDGGQVLLGGAVLPGKQFLQGGFCRATPSSRNELRPWDVSKNMTRSAWSRCLTRPHMD